MKKLFLKELSLNIWTIEKYKLSYEMFWKDLSTISTFGKNMLIYKLSKSKQEKIGFC